MTSSSEPLRTRVVASLTSGTAIDLIPDAPEGELVGLATMLAWGPDHVVDAEFLRGLLRCTDPEIRPDPRGLRLRGVCIRGRLDLDHVTSPVLLQLQDCLLEEGITADQAHLPMLALVGCRITHPTRTALNADRIRIDGSMYLNRSVIEGASVSGGISLIDARIGGSLYLCSTSVRNSLGPAIIAEGLHVQRDLLADGSCTIEGASVRGSLILLDAQIDGVFWARDATLCNSSGAAVNGSGLQVGRDIYLDGDFNAQGSGTERATVHLSNARAGGPLHLASNRV